MTKNKFFIGAVLIVFCIALLCTTALAVTTSEPPAWTYKSIDTLLSHGLGQNYFSSETGQTKMDSRYKMAYVLKDIIERARRIYNTKDYADNGLISYNDALSIYYLSVEFKEELGYWNCDTTFLTPMCETIYYQPTKKPKPPKRDFFYANAESVYVNNITTGPGAASAYDYYTVRGFVGDHSVTNKINLGLEGYSTDLKQSVGAELSGFNKSGNDILSSQYGIMSMNKNVLPSSGSIRWYHHSVGDSVSSAINNQAQVNKLWYNDYKRNIFLVVGPFAPLYTNAMVFTGLKSPAMYGPKYVPLNGAQVSGKTGQFRYELYGGVRYAGQGSMNNSWPQFWTNGAQTVPYNQLTQGVSIGSDAFLQPFFKSIFKKLKSSTWNLNYVFINDLTKNNFYPNYAMIIPFEWMTSAPGGGIYGLGQSQTAVGPQQETLWGGNLYLSNILSNIDFSFLGGRSFYKPVASVLQQVNGYAYEASLVGNYKPLTVCLGYRYIDPKYAPLISTDAYTVQQIHNPLIATINDFQMNDTDNYPNNVKGIFGWASYEFKNKSVLSLTGRSFTQIRSSYQLNRVEPGFVDQEFPVVRSAAFANQLATQGEIKIKYFLPYKKWTFDATADALSNVRNSPGFNPLGQNAKFILANASYKLRDNLYVRGGFYEYGTVGNDTSATYRCFYQSMPSVGAYYQINPNTGFDLTYRWFTYTDKLNAANNYNTGFIQTDFNWKF